MLPTRSRTIVNRLTIFVYLNNLQIEDVIEACNLQIPKKESIVCALNV